MSLPNLKMRNSEFRRRGKIKHAICGGCRYVFVRYVYFHGVLPILSNYAKTKRRTMSVGADSSNFHAVNSVLSPFRAKKDNAFFAAAKYKNAKLWISRRGKFKSCLSEI